jgi:protein SCO1
MNADLILGAPTVGGAFSLVDHDGREVGDATYRGAYVLMFFGFTNCKVVCPETLAKLSEALARVGSAAERVRALYVTVDPARDTPAVMRAFLEKRYPCFTGLTGSPEQIGAVKAAFRVFARRRDEEHGGYQMSHSAFIYVLDPAGRFTEHWPAAIDVEEMVLRLGRLLSN